MIGIVLFNIKMSSFIFKSFSFFNGNEFSCTNIVMLCMCLIIKKNKIMSVFEQKNFLNLHLKITLHLHLKISNICQFKLSPACYTNYVRVVSCDIVVLGTPKRMQPKGYFIRY